MRKKFPKKTAVGIVLFIILIFFVFPKWNEKVKISEISWTTKDKQFLVTFLAENKTKNPISGNLSIRLHKRTFGNGGPKAVVVDLVGEKELKINLSSREIREFKEFVSPKKLSLKADMVIVNPWGIVKSDT